MEDMNALRAALARTESAFRGLSEKRETLEQERAEIIRRTEAAAGDTETLAQLKIETEWVTEAKRENDRLIAQTTKRLGELEETIAMQIQNDMT
jgi:hypothetical protein